jgi:hypothetical protein
MIFNIRLSKGDLYVSKTKGPLRLLIIISAFSPSFKDHMKSQDSRQMCYLMHTQGFSKFLLYLLFVLLRH